MLERSKNVSSVCIVLLFLAFLMSFETLGTGKGAGLLEQVCMAKSNFDVLHRGWNDAQGGIEDCGCGAEVAMLTLAANWHLAPFNRGAFGRERCARVAEMFKTLASDHPAFEKNFELFCEDFGLDPTKTTVQEVYSKFQEASCFQTERSETEKRRFWKLIISLKTLLRDWTAEKVTFEVTHPRFEDMVEAIYLAVDVLG